MKIMLFDTCLPALLPMVWFVRAGACPSDQASKVLVLDDVQQLLAAADGPLPSLLALREQVRAAAGWLGLIAAHAAWCAWAYSQAHDAACAEKL
jgi:hypothetical protein